MSKVKIPKSVLSKLKKPAKKKKVGAKKDSITVITKLKQLELDYYKGRVRNNLDHLFHAQIALAKGVSHLIKITKYKRGKESRQKTEVVEDPKIIVAYFNGEFKKDKKMSTII